MPDLVSHVCSGVLAGSRLKDAGSLALFCFGAVLPDLFTRPVYILWPQTHWFVHPLHAPAGIVCLCLAISGLFRREQRNRTFLLLLGGSFFHLALDLTQTQSHAYPLAFPLTWKGVHTGFVHPDTTLLLIPAWVAIALLVMGRRKRRAKLERSRTS